MKVLNWKGRRLGVEWVGLILLQLWFLGRKADFGTSVLGTPCHMATPCLDASFPITCLVHCPLHCWLQLSPCSPPPLLLLFPSCFVSSCAQTDPSLLCRGPSSALCRTPSKINATVVEKLTPQQSAQLQAAKRLSDVYMLNKCTPDIHEFLMQLVEQQGSVAGMLRTVCVCLSHVGYQLPTPSEGMDLQYMQLTASLAETAMQTYAQRVHAGCAALGWQLPVAPRRPVLLQAIPDLLCADWEQMQRSLESPAVAPEAALGAAAGSVAAALAAAAGVVQAVARGNTSAAAAAAQQAADAAAAMLSAADGIQQQFAGLQNSQQAAQECGRAAGVVAAAADELCLPQATRLPLPLAQQQQQQQQRRSPQPQLAGDATSGCIAAGRACGVTPLHPPAPPPEQQVLQWHRTAQPAQQQHLYADGPAAAHAASNATQQQLAGAGGSQQAAAAAADAGAAGGCNDGAAELGTPELAWLSIQWQDQLQDVCQQQLQGPPAGPSSKGSSVDPLGSCATPAGATGSTSPLRPHAAPSQQQEQLLLQQQPLIAWQALHAVRQRLQQQQQPVVPWQALHAVRQRLQQQQPLLPWQALQAVQQPQPQALIPWQSLQPRPQVHQMQQQSSSPLQASQLVQQPVEPVQLPSSPLQASQLVQQQQPQQRPLPSSPLQASQLVQQHVHQLQQQPSSPLQAIQSLQQQAQQQPLPSSPLQASHQVQQHVQRMQQQPSSPLRPTQLLQTQQRQQQPQMVMQATSHASASSLVTQAQMLAAAAADQSNSSLLSRGGGMLVLLASEWGDKALPLHGQVLVADVAYSHYSILQLMTKEGLLLSGGPQDVSVRVAAACCGRGIQVVGSWSKDPFTLTVAPQHTLLMHCQPPRPLGGKFMATSEACTHTHEALFGWTPEKISAALGKPSDC